MNRIYLNMRLAIAQTQLPRQRVLKTLLGRYSYRLVWKGRRERAAGEINGSWVIFVQLFSFTLLYLRAPSKTQNPLTCFLGGAG
jgi:hypothetical protein